MASTSASASTSSSTPNPEREHTTTSEEEIVVAHPPSASATTLFSSCLNFCSFFLSLCSTSTSTTTPSHPSAFQGEAQPSPPDTDAFDQLVASTSTPARSALIPHRNRKLSYDVFINHRGPDVKHTLASTLYRTLTGVGLRVFLDSEVVQLGNFLPIEIEEAISSASLHIAIFSQNYAQSPWCLAELSFMLKTGTPIVPVFYHVQPHDVRYTKGVYADAFSNYVKKGRYGNEKLQEWKNALNSVSFNLGGIIHNDNDEGPLMKKIVASVLKEIKNVPFLVANHPVGLDEAARDFERTTRPSEKRHDSAQIVGIWGMGGSGKTALARHLYNNKYKLMEKSSFLFDVRDASSRNKLIKKQENLLQDFGLSGVSINSIEEGQGILADRLRSIQGLIVLDDVDSVDQLNALLPKKYSLGLGSLIIVTSRDFNVLQCWGISSIYKMKPLNPFHAKQLFCWHAFLQPSPYQGFEDLVQRFLSICDGLPLSLKVFGAHLYGVLNKDYWENQLKKIARILPKNIKMRLKVSYDALDAEEKEIFLDIACFFIGEKRSSAIAAWDGLGWNGQYSWEQLFNKCLVELIDSDDVDLDDDDYDRIRMQNHIRDLGREIANHWSPYRLWSPQQIIDVGNEVREIAIRGIMATAVASTSDNEEFFECSQDGNFVLKANGVNYSLEPSSLGLKFFHVRGNYYNKIIGDLSREVVWLRLQDIEQSSLQTFSSLKHLRVLELYEKYDGKHHLQELWDSESNAPRQLRELFINSCMKFHGFPKSIGCLQHLKKIIIKYGDMMRSLPEEFGLLQSLEHLELDASELSSLPSNFGGLRNLRHLAFSNCKELRRLPLSFKKLTLLQYLRLDKNGHLEEIEGLPNKLQSLRLIRCPKLDVLPSIAQLASLKEIKVIGCCGVKKIAGLEHCGATERFRNVELQTMRGSGFEGFIKNMKKCPKEYIKVCTRTVGNASKIVNSFAFPSLSVIHSFPNQKAKTELSFEWPCTAPCILLCFVLNSRSGKTTLELQLSKRFVGNVMELEERGKWVWMVLLTQHALPYDFMESDLVQGRVLLLTRNGEVETGVVVVGEEESAWQAFTHLCLALSN